MCQNTEYAVIMIIMFRDQIVIIFRKVGPLVSILQKYGPYLVLNKYFFSLRTSFSITGKGWKNNIIFKVVGLKKLGFTYEPKIFEEVFNLYVHLFAMFFIDFRKLRLA